MAAASMTSLHPVIAQLHHHLNTTTFHLSNAAQPYHDEMRALKTFYEGLPALGLLAGHCLNMSSIFRGSAYRQYWLFSFWITFSAAFGGGTIAAIMSQEPPFWFRSDKIMVVFSVCWYFITYFPQDLGFRIFKITPIRLLCKASSNLMRAKIIIQRIEVTVKKFGPTSISAPIFLGTMAGIGGRFICDAVANGFQLKTPVELARPSWGLRSAIAVSVLYMATVHWMPILPADVALTFLMTTLMAQGLAADLTGMPLDFTAPFSSFFHTVTGIPEPPPHVHAGKPPQVAFESLKSKGEKPKET